LVAPIIEEIDKAILSTKKTNDDSTDLVYRTKVTLFQFFQLKYLGGQNRDYVGFILSGSKNSNGKYQYTLKNSLIGTLNSAGILYEIKDLKHDNLFYEVLTQFYNEDTELREIFINILTDKQIEYNQEGTTQELFELINKYDTTIFDTYQNFEGKRVKYKDNLVFAFRFFRLADKYIAQEQTLFEELKKDFGWRMNYEIRRNN